ncbi:MAG: serine/threonine-protein kinase [bacterium]|nr:serine/threonine-protein kinase [bacterium]
MTGPELEWVAAKICRLRSYEYISFIGKGAFKEAFWVARGSDNLALKIIDPLKQEHLRTEREIAAITRCDCPSIARLYDHGSIESGDGRQCFFFTVEELLRGGTLTDKLARAGGTLTVPEILKLGSDLSKAIHHLQQLRLVHRDIKPDNILFRANDDGPVLVDLGLVRDLSLSSLTVSWAMRGPCTPFFACPEQLNNDKYLISWKSDQYSLGVVLWFCLTGEHPYQRVGISNEDTINAVVERQPVPATVVEQSRELGLWGVPIMLEPWPIRRFQEPSEMLTAFEMR